MEIITILLICVVMIIADPVVKRLEADSYQLESKITKGDFVKEGYKFMASLQLGDEHICSSGLFQVGLLLTTGECAWYIESIMKTKRKNGTAVLGHSNLKSGHRVRILKFAYSTRLKIYHATRVNNFYDFAVVLLADDVDYSRVQIIDIYTDPLLLRRKKKNAVVCGWGATENDDETIDDSIEYAEHSENLHCMHLTLYGERRCNNAIPPGDYKRKLICGKGINSNQMITSGDIGSPLVQFMSVNDTLKNYLVGITLRRFIGNSGTFLRFIRISSIYDEIIQLISELKTEVTKDVDRIRNSQEVLMAELNKCHKMY